MARADTHSMNVFSRHRRLFVCLFLVISTLAVYWQVINHTFVAYDDDMYVTQNHHVKAGLTVESIIWSFSFTDKGKTY